MTVANVETVRSIYAAWQRGDFGSNDWADPEIEFTLADGPAPGTWWGLAAMSSAWGETLGAFDDFRAEAEEIRALDSERVLVLTHNSGRGRTSGVDVDRISTRGANVIHVRDGKVTKLVAYWERERAFADLGLSP